MARDPQDSPTGYHVGHCWARRSPCEYLSYLLAFVLLRREVSVLAASRHNERQQEQSQASKNDDGCN